MARLSAWRMRGSAISGWFAFMIMTWNKGVTEPTVFEGRVALDQFDLVRGAIFGDDVPPRPSAGP